MSRVTEQTRERSSDLNQGSVAYDLNPQGSAPCQFYEIGIITILQLQR